MTVCENVTAWAEKNFKSQTPTLLGQIVGNTAIAIRQGKEYHNDTFSSVGRMIHSDIIESDGQLLCNILDKWFVDNIDLRIIGNVSDTSEWRIFGKTHAYSAVSSNQRSAIILVNRLERFNHSNVLHAIKNIYEIKDYYTRYGKEYHYYSFIIISQGRHQELLSMIGKNPQIKRLFEKGTVQTFIGCLKKGKLEVNASNFTSMMSKQKFS